MSLLKQQNFLAKLYTNERLRRAFTFEPLKVGIENDLSENEIRQISGIFHEEIDFFAESLFRKRMSETKKFLPMTKEILDGDFEKLFREFSQSYNPQTIKKHLEDAAEFCRFLQNSDAVSAIGRNAAKYEAAKLRIFNCGQRFAFCRLKFDVEKVSRKSAKAQSSDLNNKRKYALWVRFGNKTKHFII